MTRAIKSRTRGSGIGKARLVEMIEEATVDAYDESEQATGWFTMFEEHLELPFETKVLGAPVTVVRIDLRDNHQISSHSSQSIVRALFDADLERAL